MESPRGTWRGIPAEKRRRRRGSRPCLSPRGRAARAVGLTAGASLPVPPVAESRRISRAMRPQADAAPAEDRSPCAPRGKSSGRVVYRRGRPSDTLKTGSWCLAYNFDQALYVLPEDSERMWGLFGNFGIADKNPSPVRWFGSAGVSGASPLAGRKAD